MRDPKEALTRYHNALEDLDRAIKLDPNYPPVRRHRGNTRLAEYWALQALGKSTNDIVEQALDDFMEAVRLDRTSKTSANALGRAYLLRGSYDSAIENFHEKLCNKASALALARAGFSVALSGRRREPLEAVAGEAERAG